MVKCPKNFDEILSEIIFLNFLKIFLILQLKKIEKKILGMKRMHLYIFKIKNLNLNLLLKVFFNFLKNKKISLKKPLNISLSFFRILSYGLVHCFSIKFFI